jgi:MoxR-like ATPase
MAAYLALALGTPLLLEGAPGVGKTEAAKALGAVLARQVIRLQCYEGIDASAALYEWNYPRQMLAIRQAGNDYVNIYSDDFLLIIGSQFRWTLKITISTRPVKKVGTEKPIIENSVPA